MISLILSTPPGLNQAYPTVMSGGKLRRVSSKDLKAWKKAAGWELLAQKPKPVSGWVSVEMEIRHPGGNRRVDVDGKIKCVLDLMVSHQLIEDDSKVAKVSAAWNFAPNCPECRVVVAPVQCMPSRIDGEREVSLKQLEPKSL